MKITMDLQACQSDAYAHRGVGKYSLMLAKSIRWQASRDGIGMEFLLNANYPLEIPRIKKELPAAEFDYYLYPPVSGYIEANSKGLRTIAEELVLEKYARSEAEVIYISSVFEGLLEQAIVPAQLSLLSNKLVVATVYDLIPLLMPDIYLPNITTKTWYHECVERVKQCDLLLAISEATRQDVIQYLEIAPEKIVNIAGAPDLFFTTIQISEDDREKVLSVYNIKKNFLLYTGGIDKRKNIEGLLQSYANLDADLRNQLQVVIVCAIQEAEKRNLQLMIHNLGIPEEAIVFTGFIPNMDLVKLYNLCSLFVFPSKYEGLGLPVLEAMRCGAPVIGANNSSIAELIGRQDALFDAGDFHDIARAITRGIRDEAFSCQLREWSLHRAQEFSWDNTAKRALRAIKDAWERKVNNQFSKTHKRYHVAMMTPLPPQETGIATYTAELLPELQKHMEVDVYTDADINTCKGLSTQMSVYSKEDFPAHVKEYDAVVYQMGNSSFHTYMYEYALRYPGIVVQHDFFLSGLINYMDANMQGKEEIFRKTLLYSHGIRGLIHLEEHGAESVIWEYPMNKELADASLGMIFHSRYNFELCEKYYGAGWRVPSRHIHQLKKSEVHIGEEEKVRCREKLHISKEALVVSSFGFLTLTKCNDLLVQAWKEVKRVLDANGKSACLLFVGEKSGTLSSFEKSVKSDASICVTGFVSDEVYDDYMCCTDIAVQLRTKSRGETSRAVLDCLAYGIPTIVNAYAGFNDYPGGVVKKISATPNAEELAHAILALAGSVEERSSIEVLAKKYVKDNHDPSVIGKAYADFIHEVIQRNSLTKERFLQSSANVLRLEHFGKEQLLQIAQAYRKNFQMPYHIHRIWMFLDDLAWARFSKMKSQNVLAKAETELCRGCWKNNEMYRIREDGSIAEQYALSLGDTVVLSCSAMDNTLLRHIVLQCANIFFHVEQNVEGSVIPSALRPIIMGIIQDGADLDGKGTSASDPPVYSWEQFLDQEYWKRRKTAHGDKTKIYFDGSMDEVEKLLCIGSTSHLSMENYNLEASSSWWQRNKKEAVFYIKHGIKQNILKPGYYWLWNYSPDLAEKIRKNLTKLNTRWSQRKVVQQLSHDITKIRESGILIDLSYIIQKDWKSGIQRVVHNIFQNMIKIDSKIYAVQDGGGYLTSAKIYISRWKGDIFKEQEERISIQKGDILFCLDSSWSLWENFSNILTEAKQVGCKVYAIIYDLLLIQYPAFFDSPLFSQQFISWHDMMLQHADGIICISRTTADVVQKYFYKKGFQRNIPLPLYYFPMGADIVYQTGNVRKELLDFVCTKKTFLMVGTVEPRKGHKVVLEALQKVVLAHDVQLLVLGRDGWQNGDVKEWLNKKDLVDRILWVKDAADYELHWAYNNTEALIAASMDEGYGLPLIEAAHFGQPIICSDIPIFHEVTQEYADYFKVWDANSLAEVWGKWLEEKTHPDTRKIRIYTWYESTKAVFDILRGKTPAYKVLN